MYSMHLSWCSCPLNNLHYEITMNNLHICSFLSLMNACIECKYKQLTSRRLSHQTIWKNIKKIVWLIALVIALKDVELGLLNNFDKQDFTLKVYLLHNWYELGETTKILIKVCNLIHTTFLFWSPAGEHGMSPAWGFL